jgi:hypothetical protein
MNWLVDSLSAPSASAKLVGFGKPHLAFLAGGMINFAKALRSTLAAAH